MNNYGKIKEPFLFIIDFEELSPLVFPVSDIDPDELKYDFKDNTNYIYESLPYAGDIRFGKAPMSYERYKEGFDLVVENIHAGNSYLLNLTYPTKIDTDLSLEDIYKKSSSAYKLLYKDKFVVFSPETFVKIEDGIISSYPMKGTIDADIEDAEDIIMNDPKEIAEHNTIVDLIRNDLSIVAEDVEVERFRYIDKIQTNNKDLLQVSSKIIGRLPADYNEKIGDIISSLLPAGSVSGAPKKKTVEIIKEAEKYERGYYTGIFGIFDGERLDSAVMIRFVEKTEDGLIYKSGGGITAFSDCRKEYNELIDKVYVPIIRDN